MSEWQDLSNAPISVPVKVWCNILNGPPGDWREWTAIQQFRGWWVLLGKRARIYPSHWAALPKTPTS